MSQIVAFLRARYAERRAIAEAAATCSSENWDPGDELYGSVVYETNTIAAVVVGPYDHLDWDIRRHIAANDPADVIADCDAKLALVDLMDGTLKAAEGDIEVDHYGALDIAERTLCHLAQQFAGHPDHKGEEWAP